MTKAFRTILITLLALIITAAPAALLGQAKTIAGHWEGIRICFFALRDIPS